MWALSHVDVLKSAFLLDTCTSLEVSFALTSLCKYCLLSAFVSPVAAVPAVVLGNKKSVPRVLLQGGKIS